MRKIIHIDADCFFAAVEVRDNPRLCGKAIAVGGAPDRRGVIATCSYEARKLGVHSAMSSGHALRLCPDLQIITPNFARYKEVSAKMMLILSEFGDAIEPLSLDEAYLDVSQSDALSGSATWIAEAIRKRIYAELGLTVSAGVAPVKFLAKIASDWRKPNGFFAVLPHQVDTFVSQLPVRRLPGVGPVTGVRMQRFGLHTCADIRAFGQANMTKQFGQQGALLHERAWGQDERQVQADRIRKSISVEHTYAQDRAGAQLNESIPELLESLQRRFKPLQGDYLPHKCFVKLKFDDFSQTTLETGLSSVCSWSSPVEFARLLQAAWHRAKRPVRLVGLGLRIMPSRLAAGDPCQLCLF